MKINVSYKTLHEDLINMKTIGRIFVLSCCLGSLNGTPFPLFLNIRLIGIDFFQLLHVIQALRPGVNSLELLQLQSL